MYQAPIKDLHFVLDELLGVASLAALPRYREFSSDLATSVIEQAARFAQDVLAPINRIGDRLGANFRDGAVQMPAQFRSAYQQFIEGGWTSAGRRAGIRRPGRAAGARGGGRGDLGFGANVAFMLCPLLARGAVRGARGGTSPQLQAQAAAEDRAAASGPAP